MVTTSLTAILLLNTLINLLTGSAQDLKYLEMCPGKRIDIAYSLCYQYYQRVQFKSLTVSLFNTVESYILHIKSDTKDSLDYKPNNR